MVSLATHVASSGMRFVGSGASCHMTGVREHFTSLTEDDIDLEVMLGDNTKGQSSRSGDNIISDGVITSFESDRYSLCSKAKQELDISLQY